MAYKRIISLILIALGVLLTAQVLKSKAFDTGKNGMTYLVVGFDDAAENTDVLFILNYRPDKNEIRVIQIPRDSYFDFGSRQNKINQYFAYKRADNLSRKEAIMALRDEISHQFDIEFDGYFGLSTEAFKALIDEIGGVRVYTSHPFEITDASGRTLLSLKVGENILDSKEALLLVRHRRSYATADLGRLDAQKLFISGFIRTLTENVGAADIIRLARRDIGILVDIPIADVIRLITRHFGNIKDATMSFVTLPGRAAEIDGIGYYILNRKANEKLFFDTFDSKVFDKNGRFTNSENKIISSIYNDDGIEIKIQSALDLNMRIIIPENKRGKGDLYGIRS